MEAEAQRSDVRGRGVNSCRALLGPSHSGLMVFPAPQDPLGLGVSLGAEKSKSLLLSDFRTCRGMVFLWQSPGFRSPASVLGKSLISLSLDFLMYKMEMVN